MEALRDVAEACIKAGIVSQGIDRLASTDRRQVYEAFFDRFFTYEGEHDRADSGRSS